MTEISPLWVHMPSYIIGLPVLTGLLRLSRLGRDQKRLFLLASFELFLVLSQHMAMFLVGSNLPLFHLVAPLEMLCILYIFTPYFVEESWAGYLRFFVPILIVFGVLSALFWQGLDQLPTYVRTLESFMVTFLSLAFLFVTFRDLKIKNPLRTPVFWYVAANLIYFTSNTFIFFYGNLIHQDKEYLMQTWLIHTFLLVVFNIFLTIALLWKEHPSTSSRDS